MVVVHSDDFWPSEPPPSTGLLNQAASCQESDDVKAVVMPSRKSWSRPTATPR